MHKNVLWVFFILLVAYFCLVFCEEVDDNSTTISIANDLQVHQGRDLEDEARTRKRHKYFSYIWGWHALAIAYWIKVKVVIVSFFLGSAIFLGLRYFWPHKCKSDIAHDGPIIYEHPHSFDHHHDVIPYSSGHFDHFDHSPSFVHSSSFDPYSAYSSDFSNVPVTSDTSGLPASAIDVSSIDHSHSIRKRSPSQLRQRKPYRQQTPTEEQIANFMFAFLGLDSKACRRRFICEMEFRSNDNPLTGLAFRMMGRGFFEKYLNHGKADSFAECAIVNADCVFIEQNESSEQPDDNELPTGNTQETDDVSETEANGESIKNTHHIDNDNSVHSNDDVNLDENIHSSNKMEKQNIENLVAEKRWQRRRRTRRQFDYVTGRILAQRQNN